MLRKLAGALAATALLAVAAPAAAASDPQADLFIQWNPTSRPTEVYSYTITCDPDGGTAETDWYMDVWRACDDLRQAGGDLDKLLYQGGAKCPPTTNGALRTRITGTAYGNTISRDEQWPDWTCLRSTYGWLFIY
ncbi:Subtilisin inhibitor-like [Nonomuraea solani]|uniref:Subtilisin inhibitor-like n=1 Tax=Nonomuraea solani TaxID=1144553 RepID=A0A1H6F242_9ACTN|nr:hypothetical protein [Nonomuraea solani]SEH03155.1 Subtilisin inhibitor-like [Nonomuraea solani]